MNSIIIYYIIKFVCSIILFTVPITLTWEEGLLEEVMIFVTLDYLVYVFLMGTISWLNCRWWLREIDQFTSVPKGIINSYNGLQWWR